MITARECQYDEVKKFRNLEGEYHYMGESHKSVAIGAFAISAKVAFGDEEAAATAEYLGDRPRYPRLFSRPPCIFRANMPYYSRSSERMPS